MHDNPPLHSWILRPDVLTLDYRFILRVRVVLDQAHSGFMVEKGLSYR
jgi:hypothetical protein